MVIQKSFKFRIYPIRKQEKRLEECLNQACWLYNQLLDIHQQIYLGEKRTLTQFDMNNLLTDLDTPNLYSQTKQNIPKRISDAFNHFFRRVKNKEKAGFPKFKKRVFYKSITFPQYKQEIINDRLYISKVGMIKIKKHREIEGNVKTLTIKKEGNEWYAVFSCENIKIEKKEVKNSVEGIDVGLNKFLVCSNGLEIENPKFLRKSEKKLKKIQRRLSKKKRGSSNRRKAKLKLNKQHTKVRRQREDFLRKTARNLTKEIKYIGVENLNIKGMVKNHYLAKSINDVGWGYFFEQLKYYKNYFEGEIIEIGRFEPTSQLCSNCGNREEMTLNKRIFKCSKCGLGLDRDFNASKNIKNLTIQKINNTCGKREINAFGDIVSRHMDASVVELGNYRESV